MKIVIIDKIIQWKDEDTSVLSQFDKFVVADKFNLTCYANKSMINDETSRPSHIKVEFCQKDKISQSVDALYSIFKLSTPP